MKKLFTLCFLMALVCVKGWGQTATFNYTGASQTFTVPAGVTSISVKIWGAGGAGSTGGPSSGGSGALVKGTLTVTSGQVITVVVGGGGNNTTVTGGYGGGGNAGTNAAQGGSGGGYSGIFSSSTLNQANALAIAGGGAGGGYYGAKAYGGGGGNTSGSAGGAPTTGYTGGGGGTASAGGAGGTATQGTSGAAGTALTGGTGGTSTYSGGGGGGGYFGGGGGYGGLTGFAVYSGGGGGGSSYLGSLTTTTNTAGVTSNGTTTTSTQAPGSAETGYVTGVGNGGGSSSSSVAVGGNGLIIITYSLSCTPPTTQATIGSYTNNNTGNSLTVNWTRGNGNSVLVVARPTATTNVAPVSGTSYTANAAYGSGSTTGTGNYVVYSGTGTSVNVTGLSPNVSYTFTVYEFNTTGPCYTTTGSSSAITTLAACTNTSMYPASSFVAPAAQVTYTITTAQYQQEYNQMTGATAGTSFTSTGSISGTYITVRSGTFNGPVVASGLTPLTWTAPTATDYFIHYNVDNSCTTASNSMTTTITNNTPLPVCVAPTTQPTGLTLSSPTYATTSGSFTTNSAGGYLVIRSTGTVPTQPANGTTYTASNIATLGSGLTFIQSSSATSFTDASLTGNTAYTYYVYSYNNTSCSNGPAYSTVTPLSNSITTIPAAPASPAASSITSSSFLAGWTAPAGGAAGYYLDVSTSSTFTSYVSGYQNLNVGNVTTYSVTGLTSGTTYYFRVRASNATGTSASSSIVTVNLLCAAPITQPTGLTLSSPTYATTSGSFTTNSAGGYLVIRSTGTVPTQPANGTTYTASNIATLGTGLTFIQSSSATTFTDASLTGNTAYTYYVYSYNNTSCSNGPAYSTVTPLSNSITTIPAPPTTMAASAITGTSFSANWTAPAGGATGYYLDVSTNSGFTAILPAYNNLNVGNVTTYPVTGLAGSTSYYYRVRAYNTTGTSVNSNVTSTATACPAFNAILSIGGTTTTPGSVYPTITAAIAALQVCGVSQPTILALNASYDYTAETYPIALTSLTGMSSTNTVTIEEAAGVTGKSIISTSTTATFNITGGKYWIIDGRSGGTGSTANLIVSNTNTTGGAAIQFINDAQNNIVEYTTLKALYPSITSGIVNFGTTISTGTGNNNNTVTYCNVDGGASALIGIYSSGYSTAIPNSGNNINNNNIYDIFGAASSFVGVNIVANSSAWTIRNNKIYQSSIRTYTAGVNDFGIYISSTSGGGYTVSNNIVGYANSSQTGTMTLNSNTYSTNFYGVYINTSTTVASEIQGNMVAGISLSTGSGDFYGIDVNSGLVNIGTTTANTIGSTSGNTSIVITNGTTGIYSYVFPIYSNSAATVTIQNNIISGISTGSGSFQCRFWGIYGDVSGTNIISANQIGSSSADAIRIGANGSTTVPMTAIGIFDAASGTQTISSNTVNNLSLYSTYTSGTVAPLIGIYSASSTSSATAITSNTISNLNTNSTIATGYYSALGIDLFPAATQQTIKSNTISAIRNINATIDNSSWVGGIYLEGNTGGALVSQNRIYDLTSQGIGNTPILYGIYNFSGSSTIFNNMVSLTNSSYTNTINIYGLRTSSSSTYTNNFYYNSVYIGGSGTSTSISYGFFRTSSATVSIKDNILINVRTGTGTNYAIGNTASTPASGWTSDYNVYNAPTTTIGIWGTTPETLAGWQSISSGDAHSKSGVLGTTPSGSYVTFINNPTTGDLHVTPDNNCALASGTLITGYTTDYDGDTRNASTPDIGADEFASTFTLVIMNPAAVCSGTSVDLTAAAITAGSTSGAMLTYYIDAAGIAVLSNPSAVAPSVTTTYYIKAVKGSCNSINPVVVTVNPPTAITTQPTAPAATCSGSGTQTITVAATGTGLTYTWRKDGTAVTNGGVISGQGTATLTLTNPTAANAGSYDVIVTGTCAPLSVPSNAVTVSVNPNQAIALTSGTGTDAQTVCSGNNIAIITYSVTGGGTNASITAGNLPSGITGSYSNGVFTISGSATVTTTTLYTYTVTTTGVCTAATASGTITVKALPTKQNLNYTGSIPYCNPPNLGLDVTLNNSQTGVTYQLYQNGSPLTDANATQPGSDGTEIDFGVRKAGTYTVFGAYTAGTGCLTRIDNNSLTLYEQAPPTAQSVTANGVTATSAFYCAGGTGVAIGLANTQTGVLYQLFLNGNPVLSGGNPVTASGQNGVAKSFGNQTAAGTYTVQASGTCGGIIAMSNSVMVSIDPTSVAGSIAGASPVCTGTNSTTLTLSGNTGTIQWQSSTSINGTYSDISGATGQTYMATNLTATTYYRAVVTSGTCSSATTASVAVTVNPTSVAGTISGAGTVCTGTNSTTLTLSGNTGTIQWQSSTNNTTFSDISGATTATYTATNLTATTYYRAVVTSGSCSAAITSPATITVSPTSVAGTISGGTTVCTGTNSTTLTLSGYTGTIQWQSSTSLNGTYNSITGATSGTYVATNLTATTYYKAVVTSDACSSATTSPATITVSPQPAATISYIGTPFCSTVTSVPVTFSGTAGGTYSSATGLTIDATSGTITPSTSTAGTYTVTYTVAASGGCAVYTTTATVTITVTPSATISYAGTPFCSSVTSAPVTFSGTAGGTYSSATGLTIDASSGTITPSTSTPGTYTVTYTVDAAGGCAVYTTTTSVTINVIPTASITGPSSPVCAGSNSGVTITNTGTATETINYTTQISGGTVVPNSITLLAGNGSSLTDKVTSTTTYTITSITNGTCANNSPSNAVVTVTVVQLPSVAAITTPNNYVAIGSNITLQNITTGGVWAIDNTSLASFVGTPTNTPSPATAVIHGIAAGTPTITYTVSATTNGLTCTNQASLPITVYDPSLASYRSFQDGKASDASTWEELVNGTWVQNGDIPDNNSNINIRHNVRMEVLDYDGTTKATATITSHIENGTTIDGTLTIFPGRFFQSQGNVDFGDKLVVLKSDATGTGAIGTMKTDIAGASNVQVERFTDGKPSANNTTSSRRAWRLITSPVTGQTIHQSWQEDAASNAVPNAYGTLITGYNMPNATTASAQGYDFTGASLASSIKRYDFATNAWISLPSPGTLTSLQTEPAYMLFVRGDRTIGANTNMSTTATLRSTGTLQQGTRSLTFTAGKTYVLVGNPYASAIDFGHFYSNSQSNSVLIKDQFYSWNSTIGAYGAYVLVTHDGTNGYKATPDANLSAQDKDNYKYIPNGSGFFVTPASATTAGTISFHEEDKAPGKVPPINPFRVVPNATNVKEIIVNLNLKDSDTSLTLADGFRAKFSADYEGNEEDNSSTKLYNFNENLNLVRGSYAHIIEAHGDVKQTDTLYMKMWYVTKRNYQLQILGENWASAPGVHAYLVDNYLATKQEVTLSGTVTSVNFTVNTDSASWKSDRFSIVFQNSSTVLPVTLTSVKAAAQNGGVNVTWTVSSEQNIKTYTVERSINGGNSYTAIGSQQAKNQTAAAITNYQSFDAAPQMGSNLYRIRIETKEGVVTYSSVVTVVIGEDNGKILITLYPNPVRPNGKVSLQLTNLATGTYLVNVYSQAGQTVYQKKITISQANTTQSEELRLGGSLAQGSYEVRLTNSKSEVVYADQLVVGR